MGDDDDSVSATGVTGRAATPATWACSDTGAETAPAPTTCGGETNASVVGDHALNVRQLSVRVAPSRSPAHHAFRPFVPHAREPGSDGVSTPESRMAAASRSSTALVLSEKSLDRRASAFRGAQANPNRSPGAPERAPWLRSAYTWAETNCCIRLSGTSVHPKPEPHCHAAFASALAAVAKNAFAVPDAAPPVAASKSEWRR